MEQEASGAVRAVLERNPEMVVWWGTAVECASAGARAADALQPASARVWTGSATGAALVTFHERLGLAARLEGFSVLPSPAGS